MRGYARRLGRLHLVAELLQRLAHLGRNDHLAVRLARVVGEVFLVVVLGDVELARLLYASDDGRREVARQRADLLLRDALLRFAGIEDDRPVLLAGVVALAVGRGRIMDAEE